MTLISVIGVIFTVIIELGQYKAKLEMTEKLILITVVKY